MTRSKHHTGWAGALAVAAELSRRGYDATLTLGNTPVLDLLCASSSGKAFKVQVKSLSSPNAVLIQKSMLEATPMDDLYFSIVIVPRVHEESLEFFILTHHEVVDLYRQMPKTRRDGRPYKPGMDGLNWRDVKLHQSRWDKLPA